MTRLHDGGAGPSEPLPPIPESTATLVVNAKVYQGALVMVDRTSEFGNPFRPDAHHSRDEVIERFRVYFLARVASEPAFRARVLTLRGKTLGCWCAPLRCHAQVIAEWLDAQP